MFDYNKLFKRDKNLINQKAKQTVSQISEIDWNPVHSWGGFILGRNKYTTTGEEKIDCMIITVGKMLDVVWVFLNASILSVKYLLVNI